MAAITAVVKASVSRPRPADVRPSRPLPRRAVCAAIVRASPGGTPREQSRDRIGHVHDEIAIIFGTTHLVPLASSSALLTIRKAFFLSPLQRSLFYQDALAFVPST